MIDNITILMCIVSALVTAYSIISVFIKELNKSEESNLELHKEWLEAKKELWELEYSDLRNREVIKSLVNCHSKNPDAKIRHFFKKHRHEIEISIFMIEKTEKKVKH